MQHKMNDKKTTQAAFSFEGYKIYKSSIVLAKDCNDSQGDLGLSFSPRGLFKDGVFTLSLELEIKDKDENLSINVELEAVYNFKNSRDLPETVCANMIAILFPYIRAYISTLTNLSGAGVVNLPTLNLTRLGDVLKNKITQQ